MAGVRRDQAELAAPWVLAWFVLSGPAGAVVTNALVPPFPGEYAGPDFITTTFGLASGLLLAIAGPSVGAVWILALARLEGFRCRYTRAMRRARRAHRGHP